MSAHRLLAYVLPAIVAVVVLALWEWAVGYFEVAPFVLPAPSAIAQTFVTEGASRTESAWVTLTITVEAFLWALTLGFLLAVLFAQSRTVERAFLPYAVTL